MRDTILAYLAGIVDGEGTITRKDNGYRSPDKRQELLELDRLAIVRIRQLNKRGTA